MGIRGLTSWLHGCASAFTKTISLEKCDLVLDAVGVAFDLLADVQEQLAAELRQHAPCSCPEPCSCVDMVVQAMTDTGAIWPYYVETAVVYLKQLQHCVGCDGKVLAVMDGCTPLSKLNTWVARARASHAAARKLSVELLRCQGSCVSAWRAARLERRVQGRSRGVHMRPGLLPAALACACATAGVPLLQAQGEADDSIMELLTSPAAGSTAQRRCVVVSNDSDFMAQPTTAHGGLGMVYPAELKACVTTHQRTQAPCRVLAFRHDRMMRVMQLPSAAAPMLGACLGNDAYDPSGAVCHALLMACSHSTAKGQRVQSFSSTMADPSPPSVDATCALLRRCVLQASHQRAAPAAASAAQEGTAVGGVDKALDTRGIAAALVASVGKALVRVPCADCVPSAGGSGGGKTKRKKKNFQRGARRKGLDSPLYWPSVTHSFVACVQPGQKWAASPDAAAPDSVACTVVHTAVQNAREMLAGINGLQHLCVCHRRELLDFAAAVQLSLLSGAGSGLLRTVHPFPSSQPREVLQQLSAQFLAPTLVLDADGKSAVFPQGASAVHTRAEAGEWQATPGCSIDALVQLAKLMCQDGGLSCAKALAVAERVGCDQLVAQQDGDAAGLELFLGRPLVELLGP